MTQKAKNMFQQKTLNELLAKGSFMKKFFLILVIVFSAVGLSFAQQTSAATQEQEFTNPLPKDKFVFLEIRENNLTQPIKLLEAGPSILWGNEGFNISRSTIILVSNATVELGKVVFFYEFRTPFFSITKLNFSDTLPFTPISTLFIEEEIKTAHINNKIGGIKSFEKIVRPNIVIAKVYSNGGIIIIYNKNEISLLPGQAIDKKIELKYIFKKPIEINIKIVNRGVFKKENVIFKKDTGIKR